MASLEEIRRERLEKAKRLKAAGQEIYPIDSGKILSLQAVANNFRTLSQKRKTIAIAGRIMALRDQGSLIFLDLNDDNGQLQALLKKSAVGENSFQLFKHNMDIGDFVEFQGSLFLTKKKERTMEIKNWRMLAKSFRPLPDKWSGLQDIEERFRRRYLDSLMDKTVREKFVCRSRIIACLRSFLDEADYLEVETPILQHLPGGASALPFVTRHNALDIDLYLRVSPELYLKKMLVGGFNRVYEFARDFRNEGIDVTHNPEFTVLEFYESFSNAKKQMIFVEKMLKQLVKKLKIKQPFVYLEHKIDLRPKFKTITYLELLKKYAGLDNPLDLPLEKIKKQALELEIASAEKETGREKILDLIYKKHCRPKLIQPTFVIDYPKDYLPLAKTKTEDRRLVDAFQLIVGGLELVKAFSELNDPQDQAERFKKQEEARSAGDAEAQPLDQEFIEALEYGLPPAGGVGLGIDRLVMLLTNSANIREVIFFPTLRPK